MLHCLPPFQNLGMLTGIAVGLLTIESTLFSGSTFDGK